MSKKAVETITKTPTEDIYVNFSFNDDDFGTGVNLTGTPTIVELTTSDLTLTQKTVSARQAQVHISGGNNGTAYNLKCTANDDTSPTAQIHEGSAPLTVESAG